MTVPGNTALFHTGIIVDDLDEAMSDMSEAFGYEWCEPQRLRAPLWTPRGVVEVENIAVFSLGMEHSLELIQQVDVSGLRLPAGGQRIHHLGFWVDDVDEQRVRLEAMGYPPIFARISPEDESALVSYHSNPTGGLYFELLDRRIKPAVDSWLAGTSSFNLTSGASAPHSHGGPA